MEFQNVKAACKSGGESAKQLSQLHHQAHDDADEGKRSEGDSDDFRPILRTVGSGSVAIHPLVPRPLRFRAAAMIMPHTSAEAVMSGGWNSRFHGFFRSAWRSASSLRSHSMSFRPQVKAPHLGPEGRMITDTPPQRTAAMNLLGIVHFRSRLDLLKLRQRAQAGGFRFTGAAARSGKKGENSCGDGGNNADHGS